MKLIIIAISLLAVSALLVFCKQQKYTADNLPKEQIRFGKGGGFSGMEESYTLLENGQLFDRNKVALDSAKRRIAKTCFKAIGRLGLEKLDFKHPGNTYSFIEVPAADGSFNRIAWGAADAKLDSNIVKLHGKLMGLLPKVKN
jgi:hypothetical protein